MAESATSSRHRAASAGYEYRIRFDAPPDTVRRAQCHLSAKWEGP